MRPLTGALVFTGQGATDAPPGAEAIGITLGGVALQGGLPQMAEANAAYVARLTRGPIPLAEIFAATDDLQAAYDAAGFALTRIILARQSLRNGGQLRVHVVNGFIEAVETDRVPERIRGRIETLTGPLVNKPGLNKAELERRLILAGEVPGTALNAGLDLGSVPGAAIVTLDPEYQMVTGFVGGDNSLDEDLGKENLRFGLELNSALGFGETIYARLSGSPTGLLGSMPLSRTLSFGTLMPLGSSGAALNLEVTDSESFPTDPFDRTRSDYERASLRFIYPLIRRQDTRLTGQVAVDLVEDRREFIYDCCPPDPIFRDELTVVRVGVSGSRDHADGAVTQGSLVFSRGIDALGARTLAEVGVPGLSRDSADAVFSKLAGSLSHRRQLNDTFTLAVDGRFQSSFGESLLTSEQFTLVGPQELSAFASGDLRGDSGWVLRAELSTTIDARVARTPVAISPYIFGARGSARIYDPMPVFNERSKISATNYGVGVDLFAKSDSAFRSGILKIEYGRGERDDVLADENRLSLSGTLRF